MRRMPALQCYYDGKNSNCASKSDQIGPKFVFEPKILRVESSPKKIGGTINCPRIPKIALRTLPLRPYLETYAGHLDDLESQGRC